MTDPAADTPCMLHFRLRAFGMTRKELAEELRSIARGLERGGGFCAAAGCTGHDPVVDAIEYSLTEARKVPKWTERI